MPRKPRQSSPTGIYHVVVKGVNSQLMFEERRDYLKYIEILEYQKEICKFELFAYCLMSNHVHLLIRINESPLDSVFRKINTTYSNWFNMKYSRTGPLQDGRYYSEPINSVHHFLSALKYIHRNPIKSGLEKSIGSKYQWNSYNAYIQGKNGLVDIEFAFSEINNIDEFVNFHSTDSKYKFIEEGRLRKRIPDDVAIDIIKKDFHVKHPEDISDFPLINRRNAIIRLNEKGISARQINRLTGIPRGVVDRILSNKL